MHHPHELVHTLMTRWFPHTDLFKKNEIMPLLHGTLHLFTEILSMK